MSVMNADFFVEELHRATNEFAPPVRSLVDIDFYKLTTGQLIFKHHRYDHVTFELIVRDKTLPIAHLITEMELRHSLDYARSLRLRRTDLYYLRGINLYQDNMFREDYLDFLRQLKLPPYSLEIKNGEIRLKFSGSWAEVTFWETIALAIISELYYRAVFQGIPHDEWKGVFERAQQLVLEKLEIIQKRPSIRFADFSHRRRHSFLWQKWVLKMCQRTLGDQFTGTSNVYLAWAQDLVPIGTSPHEPVMAKTALAQSEEGMRYAQYQFLEEWMEMYGQGLRVFLPDTYGSDQFYKYAPSWLSSWRGQRQDSGDPIEEGERYVKWLTDHNQDPSSHITIFSDGLDVGEMVRIDEHFKDSHQHPYGWGTLLGNDFRGCHENKFLRPISMVCKVVDINGRPCVKLSNNINKATGPKDEIERYLKVFGTEGRKSQVVVV